MIHDRFPGGAVGLDSGPSTGLDLQYGVDKMMIWGDLLFLSLC